MMRCDVSCDLASLFFSSSGTPDTNRRMNALKSGPAMETKWAERVKADEQDRNRPNHSDISPKSQQHTQRNTAQYSSRSIQSAVLQQWCEQAVLGGESEVK